MRLVLRQSFPLGRFHATPWRVNPFDDPFGEWPPSPWRLVRAVVARWYQWSREEGEAPDLAQLDELVRALCDSSYSFHLPVHALRGKPLRQYHPVEFSWKPPGLTKGKGGDKRSVPRMRTYGTSLVQDNYWCVPADDTGAVWWFIDGGRWTGELAKALVNCLERLTYFGRAETLTQIRCVTGLAPEPNCVTSERPRSPTSVRVLVPKSDATREDAERVTEDPRLAVSVPPGTRIMYADLPARPPVRQTQLVFPVRSDCRLVQFAIGWSVPPEPRSTVRLTARYRSAVLRELLLIKSQNQYRTWSAAPEQVRQAVTGMFGKDADGKPLTGHRHAEFLAWWQDHLLTRLLVWRGDQTFDADEQAAILRAASQEMSWAAAGPDADAWKLRLIPLDSAVQPPPGFDQTCATVWESLTPYVPSRHHLRGGRPRASESLVSQIRRELTLRGVAGAEQVGAEEIDEPTWVAVHLPRRQAAERAFVGDRRGYWLRLTFNSQVAGPLRLGHSSSFGLGLFKPIA
jgi:CRISPR-associated protein Csb2